MGLALRKKYLMSIQQAGEPSISPRLPAGYQEVEYIEGSGTQFINVGIGANQIDEFYLDFALMSITHGRVYGSYQGFTLGIGTGSFWGCGGDVVTGDFYVVGQRYNLYQDTRSTTATLLIKEDNGTTKCNLTNHWTSMSATTIYLLDMHYGNSPFNIAEAKIYSCRIKWQGNLVRDFVPCYRKSDSEIGLYDLVNDVFYTNQGSGTFTCGVPIIYDSRYQQVEYIESSGTQYIDTNFKPKNTTKIEFDMTLTSYGGYVFGSWDGWQDKMFTIYNASSSSNAIGYGANWVGGLTGITTNSRIMLEIDNGVVKFSGTTKGTYADVFSGSYNLYFFATNNGSEGVAGFASLKLHSCQIYDNGTLVRNFVPVYRKSDNEIGLLDIVNNVFYTNQGSGVFTKGNDTFFIPTQATSFATDEWSVVATEAERISNYYQHFGTIPFDTPYGIYDPEHNDTNNVRTITLSTNEQIQIAIIGMCHDTLTSAYSGGGTKAGITWCMVDGLATKGSVNSTNTNVGGWRDCAMRSQMTTYLGQLPSALQSMIKQVEKTTSAGNQSSTIYTTTDKLFLLSMMELNGNINRRLSEQYSFAGEGTQYDYFKNAPLIVDVQDITWSAMSGTKGTSISNGNAYINAKGQVEQPQSDCYVNSRYTKGQGINAATVAGWWLRSPYTQNAQYFDYVTPNGGVHISSANGSNLVVYAGCI